jgi:lysozyme family protein
MKENFDAAFRFTIGAEGKPTDDPHDPGGFTIWGLARRFHPEITPETTIEYAQEVYRREYWNAIHADDLPDGLDIAAFDTAVNLGPSVAGRLLRRADDWRDYLIARLKQYSELVRMHPEKIRYFRGWANRVFALWDAIKKGSF